MQMVMLLPRNASTSHTFRLPTTVSVQCSKIYTLTANGKEEGVTVNVNENVQMAYTGRNADGLASQGVNLNEKRFGARCSDLGLVGAKSFSVTFWLKLNKLALGETQLLSVANKLDGWPKTDWGWIWSNIQEDGSYRFVHIPWYRQLFQRRASL